MRVPRLPPLVLVLLCSSHVLLAEGVRTLRFNAATPRAARQWQEQVRAQLFALMMGGGKPKSIPLDPRVLQRLEPDAGSYALEELSLQTLPDRRVHVWMAVPKARQGPVGAVLALHGHGGTGRQVVRGEGLYWYGRALAEMGYVVISPDIGQHELQHPDWTLMGERVWDALRCVDYLVTRPEVDPRRLAVAGLSLGGETTMYVAALEPRLQIADSSGWLTTVENMKHGHCPCWHFPGLEEHFDFADIFGCIAPRPLILEIGMQERAPGGFPVEIARQAFAELQPIYRMFGAAEKLVLDVHPGGHIFRGAEYWLPLKQALGTPWPWRPPPPRLARTGGADELLRRGEIARRHFSHALGILEGWWATRDAATGLYPRRLDQRIWSPQDNAADMFPFLALTAYFTAPERLDEVLQILPKEKQFTDRLGVMPDWFNLTNRTFYFAETNLPRLIFNAAEYCKDGLLPLTEMLGRGPWVERLIELTDAIMARAPVSSDYGLLPADDTEVNGDVLQTHARLYAMTRDPRYLEFAERIGDAYCFEVLPQNGGLPAYRWDFTRHRVQNDSLNLNDHGNELLGGLAELYVLARAVHPEKAARYRQPLQTMFHRLLDTARNADGLWFNLIQSSTGKPLHRETPDTWGYALCAAATFALATDDAPLLEAVPTALRNLHQGRYLFWWDADAYADALEGATYLLNRFPVPEASAWMDTMLPLFLGKLREDGIVEGWYGDGNSARTALLVARYFTQGTWVRPWRSDVRLGAARAGKRLQLALTAAADWDGKLLFDQPRHRLVLNLPTNYLRLNEWSEWFTVEADRSYQVKMNGAKTRSVQGTELIAGLPVQVKSGKVRRLEVIPD